MEWKNRHRLSRKYLTTFLKIITVFKKRSCEIPVNFTMHINVLKFFRKLVVKNLQIGCEHAIIQLMVKNVTIKAVIFIRHLPEPPRL